MFWAMAKTGSDGPEFFDVTCMAAIDKVKHFDAQGLANAIRAKAKIGTNKPEVFDVLCVVATEP